MPRPRAIYAATIDLRRWQIDVDAISKSSRGDRREHFSRIIDRLDLTDDALIALVHIKAQPQHRRGARAYGPQRNALVIFPHDETLNWQFKSLGSAKAIFDGHTLGWVLPIDSDHAADRLIQWLLKLFDILVVKEGSSAAFVHH